MLSDRGPRIACHRIARDDAGSTMLMYPFAVLIVFALGAIAIDGAVLFQSHRQAVDVASGLASDIAGVVDERAYARNGTVGIDRDRAARMLAHANDVLADQPDRLRCRAVVDVGAVAVEVTCQGTGRTVLLPLGGGSGALRFSATSRAMTSERR